MQKTRTDKRLKVWPGRAVQYTHYLPHSYSIKTYGWSLYNFKSPTLDFYFGKHTFVFMFRRV